MHVGLRERNRPVADELELREPQCKGFSRPSENGRLSSTSIENGESNSGGAISPARTRSTARCAAAAMMRRARAGGTIVAAVRLNARFTTAVSIPGQTRVISAATTSSPAMRAVGTPNCAATVAKDLALAHRPTGKAHIAVLAVADGVGADARIVTDLRVVTDEEDGVERIVERRHRRRAASRLTAHDVDLGIDLVEHEIAQRFDAVVLLDDELRRARGARSFDGRVDVAGHPRTGPLVVLTAGDDVLPTGDAADAFHIDRDEDAHGAGLPSRA